jgi:hypothetical protein
MVDAADDRGATPLHYAAEAGQVHQSLHSCDFLLVLVLVQWYWSHQARGCALNPLQLYVTFEHRSINRCAWSQVGMVRCLLSRLGADRHRTTDAQ